MKLLRNQHFLFWLFLAMLILPNVLMFFTESTSTLTRVLNITLPLSAFWLAMTLSHKPGKMFWWLFFFSFLAAFQIVLLYLFGESPIAVDMFLNVFTTNPTEVNELLSQLLPAVVFVFVVYGVGIALSIVSIRNRAGLRPSFVRGQRIIGGGLLAVSLILLDVDYVRDERFRPADDIFPINGCYNFLLSFDRIYRSAHYEQSTRGFSHQAVDTRADTVPEVYVLVIGETLRADNMALYGYPQATTPRMSERNDSAGDLAVFADAITMSNTTHKSVPLLLTSAGAEAWDSVYTQRGLIAAFGEAGYETGFFSNQRRNKSFIDFLGSEAIHVRFIKDGLALTEQAYDMQLVDEFKRWIDGHKASKNMVVLHCYGSHFDYRDRYPEGFGSSDDTHFPTAEPAYRQQLVNAYDNTVQYADHVWDRLLTLLETDYAAVVVFTSDHGEDIYDDDRARFLHASPIPTYYQLRVPYVIWASRIWQQRHQEQWDMVLRHTNLPISTNMVTFHTLLDLAGVQARLLRNDLALGNAAFAVSERRYVNDHNEYRPLDDCGLKQQDIALFEQRGLRYP